MQAADPKHPGAFLCAFLLVLIGSLRLGAQTSAVTNHVLELDGKDSYVRLPDNIFHEFTEGTVEAWVNWDEPNWSQRWFNFGEQVDDMGMGPDYFFKAQNALPADCICLACSAPKRGITGTRFDG